MNRSAWIVFTLIGIVVILSLMRRRVELPSNEGFVIQTTPTLWWFVDTEHPNRAGGYLQLTLNKLYETQGKSFTIKPLYGRKETLAQISNANPRALLLPPDLWRIYVIANICAQKGGLVMDGNSTLSLQPIISFLDMDAALFGVNPDEPIVSPSTAWNEGPAPYLGWAASPQHPAWTFAAEKYNALVEAGQQAWGAASARRAFLEISQKQRSYGALFVRGIDGSRRLDGTKLQLDDVFGKTPLQLPKQTVFITYDGDELARRFEYNWFLRLSADQIRESTCAWCLLARV